MLKQYNAKSTFFMNGMNFGDATQAPYPDVMRRMYSEGHQLASHTWSHADLNTLDSAGRRSQMAQLEALLKTNFGFIPTYMRPPYGNCNSDCLADMAALGYHVILWNIGECLARV